MPTRATDDVVAVARRQHPVSSRIFHLVCRRDAAMPEGYGDKHFLAGLPSTDRFFARLPDDLAVRDKTVLDFGCGDGSGVVWAAKHGARRALGVDVARVDVAREQVARHFPELADRCEFRQISAGDDLAGERFDVVLSKNTFEHVDHPDGYVAAMKAALADDGILVIGFSPLWKSPLGGHISFMTPMPWAHLLFPEDVIMAERRRFRPDENARRFEEIKGGLNQMTLARFEDVMARSGLEPVHFEVNAGTKASTRTRQLVLKTMKIPARLPAIREYFAFSVHSVWRHARIGTDEARQTPDYEAMAEIEDHDIDDMVDAINARRRRTGRREVGEELSDELIRGTWDDS